MKRIFMSAFAALLIASSPAQAKPKHTRHQATAAQPRAFVDVAAIPAYGPGPRDAQPIKSLPMGRKHISPPIGPSVAGNGIVRSGKTGATAHVSPKYSGQFQAYIDDLEAAGASIRFMGGYRKGRCWTGGRHPCGMALDVCQLSRGRVDRRCNMPGPATVFSIAARHSLFEGGGWRSSDYGHVEAGGNNAVAVRFDGTFIASARVHHRKIKVAHR